MKHFKLIYVFFVFSFLFLGGCSGDDEPIDPALLSPNPISCSEPSFLNVSGFINGNTVSLQWDTASGDAWEVQYGTHGFVPGTGTTVNFMPTSSLITGLVSTTNYDFYIRTKCSDSDFSQWIGPVAPGASIAVCVDPTNLSAIRMPTDATKATINWSGSAGQNSWQVQYGATGFVLGSGTILASSTVIKVLSSLVPTTGYDVYVRSNCAANQNSDWVGPVNMAPVGVGTSCNTPTNLIATRQADNTTVSLSWNMGGAETSWEIQYGNVGFAAGSGTSVTSTATTKTIPGLAATAYSFYVRAKCSATENSAWFGPVNIAAAGGVDSSPPMMTANIAGTQYNHMQPYMYPISFSVQVISENGEPTDPQFLWIQGDTSNDLTTSKEINLYIPNNLWHPGTYNLSEHMDLSTTTSCHVHMISEVMAGPITYIDVTGGTLTVTEFNLVTRRAKGTFSFTYEKEVDDVLVGTFQVTNGTFNYYLDDSYFD